MRLDSINTIIDERKNRYTRLADEIWSYAELGYNEFKSARLHIDDLKESGFTVQEGVAGIPTAFVAEAGRGGPVIGILGEYDALSGLNQSSMSLSRSPTTEISNGNGHGCGHHLLGAGAHLAAVAIKSLLEMEGLPGRVRFYGCPAEEGGWGKTFMARAGVFDDLDAALSWHPWTANSLWQQETLAVKQMLFCFSGKSAHAGNSPHLGRSALDAVELMNVGTNYLREHVIPSARIHYAITNSGGVAPNVVQPNAEVLYMIRAPRSIDVAEVAERVTNVARGAALMSGCQVEIKVHSACSELKFNKTLEKIMQAHLEEFAVQSYSNEEISFAASMQSTVGAEEIEMAAVNVAKSHMKGNEPIYCGVIPLNTGARTQLHGSTDVGDVSWVTPTVQCFTTCYASATAPHSWQWVAQGKSSIAHKGMLIAAKTLAATALELFQNPSALQIANEELKSQRGAKYVCPIPVDVSPPIDRSLG